MKRIGAKAQVIQKLLMEYGSHICYRFGVTGTFPKPKTDQYTLKCSIGQIVDEVPTSWLIANGYLSTVNIQPIETVDDADLPDYPAEKAFLGKNVDRIELIAAQIKKYRTLYGNTMVLVNNIPFGRKLAKYFDDAVFLSGESKNKDRQEEYKQFADKDDILVIASSGIASTGISIDRIFCLILIDYGKSFIKGIQSIGRGLRKNGDKNHVNVIDIYSSLKYSKKHSKDRIKYYKEAGYPLEKLIKIKY